MKTMADPDTRMYAKPALWVVGCAVAEGIGMTASAAAARASDGLPGAAALTLVVLGGLVEGTALGILQALWLRRRFRGVSMAAWIVTTVLVAGIGWSLASAPSALGGAGGAGGAAPPAILVLVGAAALGAVMGAVMGTAQSLVLRGHVRHQWRWISISAAAWTPTMVIIFAGATLPEASWSTASVIAVGAVTGLLAGTALGAVTLALMRTLDGQSVWSGLFSLALRHNALGLGRTLAMLRVTGSVSGRSYELPVQYAREGDTVVVFPGAPQRKTWWRNLEHPSTMSVWVGGRWRDATGQVVRAADRSGFDALRATYARRWPGLHVHDDAVLVRVALKAENQAAPV